MSWVKDLSIRNKLIASMLLIALLAALGLVIAGQKLEQLNRDLNRIASEDVTKIRLAERLNRNLEELRLAEKNLLSQRAELDRFVERIDGVTLAIGDRSERLRALVDVEGGELLDAFRTSYDAYQMDLERIVELARSGDHPGAASLSRTSARETSDRAQSSLSALVAKVETDLAVSRTSTDERTAASQRQLLLLLILVVAVSFFVAIAIARHVSGNLNRMVRAADAIAAGELDAPLEPGGADELGRLADSIALMQRALQRARDADQDRDWLQTGLVRLHEAMQARPSVADVGNASMTEVASYLDAAVGALHQLVEGPGEPTLELLGGYALEDPDALRSRLPVGQGLAGQAALDKRQILITDVPAGYLTVSSLLGETAPHGLCVTPLVHEGQVRGVLELGTLGALSDLHLEYLAQATPAIALSLAVAQRGERLVEALAEAQALSEELEERTRRLEESEGELRSANEELEQTNELLTEQKEELQAATEESEGRAVDLAAASEFKSQFLANMSHELRSPLNSVLLLAEGLLDNDQGNLTEEQVEAARLIQGGGYELLSLISEVLDLAKIEAGGMAIHLGRVPVADLADAARQTFAPQADAKGLALRLDIDESAPDRIRSDRKRVDQILKNLLSNAIKFTASGSVTLAVARATAGDDLPDGLDPATTLTISVIDTGIGIAPDQHETIFEAFRQADGGAARTYGGTGLGLSISRELARLLGGEIHLRSEPGTGTTFTLYLPVGGPPAAAGPPTPRSRPAPRAPSSRDSSATALSSGRYRAEEQRGDLRPGDRVVLVVGGDPGVTRSLSAACDDRGLRCVTATSGRQGLDDAVELVPVAVLLAPELPDLAASSVLRTLKSRLDTRHIPVHVLCEEEEFLELRRLGAFGQVAAPLGPAQLEEIFEAIEVAGGSRLKRILVVEDNDEARRSVVELLGNGDVRVDEAVTGEQAISALGRERYDCVVLDLGLPDMSGEQVLDCLQAEPRTAPPVVIYTARELSLQEERQLYERADSIILKDARSPERLLDEVSLCLHRVVSRMAEHKRQLITYLHSDDRLLAGKRVLLVDDDMRSAFALSQFLTGRGLEVVKAADGQQALDLLEREPGIDLVLTDIMMPGMDGYETIRRIRAQERFATLVVIAVTAKAMKEDRALCLAAGATDYLPKPVDREQLISLLRYWSHR